MSFTANLLPADVVQPFDLRYVCDDVHVMAFFENHPTYEAVEAMIRRSSTGRPVVRAILTRHDQTQVDHVNDERLVLEARATRRETCFREVSVVEDSFGRFPRMKVEFLSHAGEPVTLDITSASPPDPSRGGLSDPGNHATTSSLPIMWRGKSALAGETSQVVIAGVNYPVPVKLRAGPHFVAHNGYFTESHHMAILRAGEVVMTIVEVPSTYGVGACWTYSTPEGDRTYRITKLEPDGNVRIERVGSVSELLRGRLVGGRLQLQEVQVHASSRGTERVALALDPIGQFTIGIDGNEGIVSGDVIVNSDGTIRLSPKLPSWAKTRQVFVKITRRQQIIVLSTVIGTEARVTAAHPDV
jgi:hypothetical protein